MTRVEYINDFIRKHGCNWEVHTSPLREDGYYIKTYIFDDFTSLYELNRPIFETISVEVEVKGIKIPVETRVKLLESECWNTDDATSVKFYERW